MASFEMTVPDVLVTDLVKAIAPSLLADEVASVRTAANKVVSGAATSDSEKILLGQAFTKSALKESLLNYRAQQAAQAARVNQDDPAVTW